MEMNAKGKKNISQHFGKILRIWLFSIRHQGGSNRKSEFSQDMTEY